MNALLSVGEFQYFAEQIPVFLSVFPSLQYPTQNEVCLTTDLAYVTLLVEEITMNLENGSQNPNIKMFSQCNVTEEYFLKYRKSGNWRI